MADVVLKDVTKVFSPPTRVVDQFNLHITDGEFLVLVGPSGCGKSTTLRMIAGLEEITDGTIQIGDRVVNDVHPKDRDIAMVFQNYALYPHMSVYKNMAFALKLRKVPKAKIDQTVRETARILDIDTLLDRKPKALSGGQRQRVALGRAIVREPKAFLFDEPLSNLDAKLRVETRAELKSLHMRLKTTTIYVTHDQEEAMTLGDRVVIMCDGLIQQVGTPLEVYRDPVNRFVAGFLGTPPMNFLEGRVTQVDGQFRFVENRSGVEFALPDSLASLVGQRVDEEVILGIRPEAIRFADGDSRDSGSCHLDLDVQVVEPLGDRMDVYFSTVSGTKVVARMPARQLDRMGQRFSLRVDPERMYLFEPGVFGNRIRGIMCRAMASPPR